MRTNRKRTPLPFLFRAADGLGASGKVIARHEARAPTSGRAAAALADAMGVAWRAETEEAKR